ncbi:MAG: metallophosphoesterase [Eubacterium sp.]|nr:metallophosphoesterase [Eubacterium sp.]
MGKRITDFMYKLMIKGLSRVLASGDIPLPDGREPIIADESADLNFIGFGDPQISALSPLRSARFYSALRDIEQAKGSFDALIIAGDVTEYGAACEFKMTARLLESVSEKFGSIFLTTGNHDIRIRRHKRQLRKIRGYIGEIKNGVPHGEDSYFFSKDINGYRFIIMGSDRNTFEAAYLSDAQLEALDGELKTAGNKPVFVINHQPLKYTNGLPYTWMGKGSWRGSVGRESDKLKEIFERHGNVIFITGHLHFGISEYNYEDYGKYKCISLPTVGVLNHGKNDKLAQGYVFTVKGNTVTARARCFAEGRYYGGDTENSLIEINC